MSKFRPKWIEGIHEEFTTLENNETYEVVDKIPPGVRIFPSAIILKVKRDPAGRAVRYKARLVAGGNLQSDPVDYTELYAPVVCIELVSVLLSVEPSKN